MSCKVELIPISEGNRIAVKEEEKVLIGRGSSLGCNDKKISRQHAELFLKKNDTLWVKPIHTNPVFYRPAGGKTIQLSKDIEQELKDGDQISLLPASFSFRISFSTETNEESKTEDSDAKSRKLPTWMSTSDSRPSLKRRLSEEKVDDSKTNKSPTKSDTSAAIVPDKPTVPKSLDSESDDGFDSVAPKKKVKSSDKPRSACSYGASCYRKNAAHRTEQSHPGDSDYEEEKESKEKKDDKDDDKPVCPYGSSCYRKNPEHKRDYKH